MQVIQVIFQLYNYRSQPLSLGHQNFLKNHHCCTFKASNTQLQIHSCVFLFYYSNTFYPSNRSCPNTLGTTVTPPPSSSKPHFHHLQLDLVGKFQRVLRQAEHTISFLGVQGIFLHHYIVSGSGGTSYEFCFKS